MPSSARKNQSPAWKNPREVFKKNLYKRKSSSRQLLENVPSKDEQNATSENLPVNPSPRKKAKLDELNPFKKPSPTKRTQSAQKSSQLKLINWNSEANNSITEFDVDWDDSVAQQPFDTSIRSITDSNTSFVEQNLVSLYPVDFSHLAGPISSSTPKNVRTIERETSTHIRKDLRVGTKLRIVSKKPFPWIKNINATGLSNVTIPPLDKEIGIKHVSSKDLDSDSKLPIFLTPLSKLQMSSCYFLFPNISFMQMFPRIETSAKMNSQSKAPNLKIIDPSDATYKEWYQSFDQLFSSWKRGERRSFYVCSPKFTVLFYKTSLPVMELDIPLDETCWAINGAARLQVAITPTSKGLRQTLRDEGIEFELPLCQRSRRGSRDTSGSKPNISQNDNSLSLLDNTNTCTLDVTQSQPPFLESDASPDRENHSDEINESPSKNDLSGEEEETWLKDVGISPAKIRLKRQYVPLYHNKIYSHTVAEFSQRTSGGNRTSAGMNSFNDSGLTAADDKHARSTALITDSASITGIYNMLLNSKIGRVMIGPQAGLPPTLIATSPFINSSLKELSKTSQVVKKNGKETQFVLELEGGPILPFVPKMIMEFLKSVPSLNSKENTISVQVNGRHPYTGFNETIDSTSFTNYNEFEYDFSKELYMF